MPTHILVSIVIVLLTAGGFVAARSGPPEPVVTAGAGDVVETPLPTPVPLETGTPLPTPAPMPQGAVVDTAVTFWGRWLPTEVTDELNEIAASGSGDSRSAAGDRAAAPAASPTPPVAPVTPPPLLPLPPEVTPVPLPLPTLAPLPDPIPSLPLPTPPPLLP